MKKFFLAATMLTCACQQRECGLRPDPGARGAERSGELRRYRQLCPYGVDHLHAYPTSMLRPTPGCSATRSTTPRLPRGPAGYRRLASSTDPALLSAAITSGTVFTNDASGNVPNLGPVQFCATGSDNCAGGGGSGVLPGDGIVTGGFSIQTSPDNLTARVGHVLRPVRAVPVGWLDRQLP